MSVRNTAPPTSSKGLSRRRWPRFDVRGRIQAHIPGLELVMPVRDISVGGFAVEAPMRFAHGEVHELHLCLASDGPRLVRARVAYCHPKRDRDHLFITGWEALGDPETARVMAGLVERFLAFEAEAPEPVAPGGQQAYHAGPPPPGFPRPSA